jgi:hypothetical protein
VSLEMADVLDRAAGKVIERMYTMPATEQLVGQVRADEAGAARNEEPHGQEPKRFTHPAFWGIYSGWSRC